MTRRFPDDDDHQIVNFLAQHRPVPPPATLALEQNLMKRIQQEPLDSKYSFPWFWVLPGAVVALMAWGSYRWFEPSPQMAANSEELETFLISSWTGVTGDSVYTSVPNNSNLSWLTLADYSLETTPTNP